MTTENLSAVVSALALLIAVVGVLIAHYWSRVEHRRQRQYATVEFWLQLADRRRELGDGLKDLGPLGARSDGIAGRLDDPETIQRIIRLLSDLEFIATAVNVGAMDIEILRRMSFTYLKKVRADFAPYIEKRRLSQPSAFTELDQMLSKMAIIRP